MSKYRISQPDLSGIVYVEDIENGKVFNGYDFMGSVDWVDYGEDCCWMQPDEAVQIISDLESADEPAEPEDPQIAKFQRILDAAILDRDSFGDQWGSLIKEGDSKAAAAHRMYIRYQQAQGFLEGMTCAIYAAGYNLMSAVDSTKLTVIK
jgi:hypothetical protein